MKTDCKIGRVELDGSDSNTLFSVCKVVCRNLYFGGVR